LAIDNRDRRTDTGIKLTRKIGISTKMRGEHKQFHNKLGKTEGAWDLKTRREGGPVVNNKLIFYGERKRVGDKR